MSTLLKPLKLVRTSALKGLALILVATMEPITALLLLMPHARRRSGAARMWMALAVFLASLFVGAIAIPSILVMLYPPLSGWISGGPINLFGIQFSLVGFLFGGLIAFPVLIYLARHTHSAIEI